MMVKKNVRVHIRGKKCYQRIWSYLLTKSLMENFFFLQCTLLDYKMIFFTVSLNLKRICNSNNTMKKRNVACLKVNRLFKNHSFQHKRKLFQKHIRKYWKIRVKPAQYFSAHKAQVIRVSHAQCVWLDIHTCMKNLYESVNPMRN